jgi:esterase
MDYPAMAADIIELLDEQGLESVYMVGHSMGGKVAMWLALQHPQRIKALAPVDMAPVKYSHSFANILDALEALPLPTLTGRSDADARLSQRLDSSGLRAFLLQNLIKQQDQWRWRINLPALRKGMPDILDFPALGDLQYLGETLFIYGGKSDYLNPARFQQAQRFFPYARLRLIPQAGHWVYAEAPEAFNKALTGFLGS